MLALCGPISSSPLEAMTSRSATLEHTGIFAQRFFWDGIVTLVVQEVVVGASHTQCTDFVGSRGSQPSQQFGSGTTDVLVRLLVQGISSLCYFNPDM